jgi:2-polyprenyl-6-methoxyphenol hydroxylase-like FAD-dependent oxidoreductase
VETRIIVVGAGPVGLALAGEIRLGGAEVVVYDKLPAPSGESRALGFTKRVAESFDQRGLLTRLGEFRWGQRGHFGGIGIDLDGLGDDHHGVLGLPQSRTEEMLTDWLAELGVPVRRGYEVVGLRETEDGVTAEFDGPDGRHEDTAAYLVGCDGGKSTVRTLAGIETTGWESTRGMYMADVTGIELRPRPTGEYVPGGHMILDVGLGDGYYRVLIHDGSLPPHPDSDALTFTDVADAWQRMTGESIHHGSARWMAAFSNGATLAATYRSGRVLLCGDAAHDTPPLAGWGISTGIQDAVNLGWKLAAVTTGSAPEALLDTYHAERHPIGEQLLRNTKAATLLYLSGEAMDPLRTVMRELVTHQSAAGHFAGMVSGLGVRYDMGPGEHPQLGARLSPDLELRRSDGTRTRVAELLHAGHGVLIAADGSGEAAGTAAAWSDRVDVVTGGWVPAKDAERPAPEAVLLRPDGYIAWAAPGGGDLAGALGRWFGAARTPASV